MQISIGDPIPYEQLATLKSRQALTNHLRQLTYALGGVVDPGAASLEHQKSSKNSLKRSGLCNIETQCTKSLSRTHAIVASLEFCRLRTCHKPKPITPMSSEWSSPSVPGEKRTLSRSRWIVTKPLEIKASVAALARVCSSQAGQTDLLKSRNSP